VDKFKEPCAFLLSSSLAPSRQLTHAQADRMGTCYTERKKTKRAVSKVSGQEGLGSWSQIRRKQKKDWFLLFIFSKDRIFYSLSSVRKEVGTWNNSIFGRRTFYLNHFSEPHSGEEQWLCQTPRFILTQSGKIKSIFFKQVEL
jgi:hypothetical protein